MKTYIPSTSRFAGAAAAKAEQKKKGLYSNLPNYYLFCPFALDTLGTFGEEALQLLIELGGRLRNTTGDPREKAWFIKPIIVAIRRGNAASVLARILPTSRTIDQFYYF